MKIIKEQEISMVNLDCEFSEEERSMLTMYAINNMERETTITLLMEWAFVDILKKQIDRETKKIVKKPVKKK